LVTAQVKFAPAAMEATFLKPLTATGVNRLEFDPSPTSPWVFEPQQRMPSAPISAQVWLVPAAIAVTALKPPTNTGASFLAPVPSPN
jgi:hypothetical protein